MWRSACMKARTARDPGELAALEDIVGMLLRRQPEPLLTPLTLKALWWLCERAHRAAAAGLAPSQVWQHALILRPLRRLLPSSMPVPCL